MTVQTQDQDSRVQSSTKVLLCTTIAPHEDSLRYFQWEIPSGLKAALRLALRYGKDSYWKPMFPGVYVGKGTTHVKDV